MEMNKKHNLCELTIHIITLAIKLIEYTRVHCDVLRSHDLT